MSNNAQSVNYGAPRPLCPAIGTTGAAVALCSWTTIVGYGLLLAASNRALRGFGMVAVLGEICGLAAALLALPAVILYWERRRRRHPP
jgi:predicted exporter